jgi:uridine kinase
MKSYLGQKNYYLIGIAGGSASGKTYFLQSIRKVFPQHEVCIISQDDYYRPITEQVADENGEINFDLPESIDNEAFIRDVQALATGSKIQKKEYTFNNPNAEAKTYDFYPAPIIVVEGLFIFHITQIKKMLDLKIFMDSRDDIKLNRRLERDTKERGYPRETILYQWHNHVYPSYKQYLLPYKDEADIIITNNYAFDKGLELIIDHIHSILNWRVSNPNS